MEIMANSHSNDFRSSETIIAIEKSTVMAAAPTSKAATIPPDTEIPSSYVETGTFPTGNGIPDDNVVDSALLSAMRDPRERHGLLRLEQAMVDFMKEEVGYIEVGGPNNSVVISPNGSMQKTQQLPQGRQTSFQRCCLHRLADRFQIVREMTADGMIRLVKVKESRIPKKLLIDLEPSEYEEESDGGDVRVLAHKLSDTSLKGGKQMKIMKRSSSGLGSSSSLKGAEGKGGSARNRKKLSDKEKAYAEARARIFNESGGSDTADVAPDFQPSQSPAPPETTTPSLPPTPPEPKEFVPWEPESSASFSEDTDEGKKAGAVNKATWRNRRQEENDPDFQRLSGPSHYGVDSFAAAAPAPVYGYQQQYYHGSQTFTPSQGFSNSGTPAYNGMREGYYAPPSSQYYPGRGGRGRGGVALPRNAARGEGKQRADVNNLEEFPSLR